MSPTDILCFSVWEDSSLTVMARITGNAGTNITQASLTSIKLRVFDLDDDGAEVGAEATLTISSVVYDSLQTSDPRWTVDSTGYNFLYTIPAARFPTGPCLALCQFVITPTSGDPFPFVCKGDVLELLGQ